MGRFLRILCGALLIAVAGAGVASVRASAVDSLDVQTTVLEIKDRAWMIQQMATQIAGQSMDPTSRSLALEVAYGARRLHDRAEKVLRK